MTPEQLEAAVRTLASKVGYRMVDCHVCYWFEREGLEPDGEPCRECNGAAFVFVYVGE